jgi:hypothetical protein
VFTARAETLIRGNLSPREFCGGQSGSGTGFSSE